MGTPTRNHKQHHDVPLEVGDRVRYTNAAIHAYDTVPKDMLWLDGRRGVIQDIRNAEICLIKWDNEDDRSVFTALRLLEVAP